MSAILQDQDMTTKEWLDNLYQLYQEGLNGEQDHPIGHFRQAGFRQLQELDFPTRRDEDWKYTSVARIVENKFREGEVQQLSESDLQPYLLPGVAAIQLVFVNGHLQEGLSQMTDLPKGLTIQLVSDALKDEATRNWIEAQVQVEGGTGKNTFLPLNQAFAKEGIFIRADRNQPIDRPIHLVYISTPGAQIHFVHPQLFVLAESSSELTVIESYHATNGGAYFTNTANWMELKGNARINHYKMQCESKDAFQINNTIVSQDRDSCYSSYAVDLGGQIVRNNISASLNASGTDTHFYGIYLGNDNQHIDNQTFIDHAMPHCESNELYKGILTDKARGVFNGKVMVRQDAQKTNAFQQNSSLVLSPNAVMDAKPQLEIYADDVRCSHGATIGQLDETAVFYLRSRGIPETQTRNLLQQAFLGEVLNHMEIPAFAERAEALIEEKLS
mgnify:CR=1 FL=1